MKSLILGLVEPLPDRPPAPAGYGKYQNIFLSDKELSELKAEYPAECEDYIERLSRYIASGGKKYQSHAATIRCWIAKDREKAGKKKGHKPLLVTTKLTLQELQNLEETAGYIAKIFVEVNKIKMERILQEEAAQRKMPCAGSESHSI